MAEVNLTIEQLSEVIENLSTEDFRLLNQRLDRRRRNRIREIVQKARQNAAGVNPQEADRIVQEAISEVRAENAAYGRS